MAGNDDLFTALKMFQSGVKDLFAQRTIAQANDAVQQIKTQETDEFKQRAALSQVANQLTMSLAAQGADPHQMAAAVGAVGPKQYASADAAILDASLSGNTGLLGRATQADLIAKGPEIELQRQSRASAEKIAAANNQTSLDVARINHAADMAKLGKENKPSEADVGFTTNVKMAGNFLNKLEKSIKRSGTWESSVVGNKEDAANMDGLPYQLAITYAKIVDPGSVAREGEVAAAQKYLIELGPMANRAKVLKQINNMRATIAEYNNARNDAKGGAPRTAPTPATGGASEMPAWAKFVR